MSDIGTSVPTPEPPDRVPSGPAWQQPPVAPPAWREPVATPPAYQEPGSTAWPPPAPPPAPPSTSPSTPPTVSQPPAAGPAGAAPTPGAAQPGSWSSPGAGAYQSPTYQQPSPWPATVPQAVQPGPGGYMTAAAARPPRGPGLLTAAPELAASMAITVGVLVLFLAYLFIALGAGTGTPGRDRLLEFLSPADLAVGVALVVAVALVVWHGPRSRSDVAGPAFVPDPAPAAVPGPAAARPGNVAMMAGVVAGFVAAAALLRGIVDLTVPHQHGAIKVGHLFDALAAALVAAVAALWGLRSRA